MIFSLIINFEKGKIFSLYLEYIVKIETFEKVEFESLPRRKLIILSYNYETISINMFNFFHEKEFLQYLLILFACIFLHELSQLLHIKLCVYCNIHIYIYIYIYIYIFKY